MSHINVQGYSSLEEHSTVDFNNNDEYNIFWKWLAVDYWQLNVSKPTQYTEGLYLCYMHQTLVSEASSNRTDALNNAQPSNRRHAIHDWRPQSVLLVRYVYSVTPTIDPQVVLMHSPTYHATCVTEPSMQHVVSIISHSWCSSVILLRICANLRTTNRIQPEFWRAENHSGKTSFTEWSTRKSLHVLNDTKTEPECRVYKPMQAKRSFNFSICFANFCSQSHDSAFRFPHSPLFQSFVKIELNLSKWTCTKLD